jgi:hypothetical protein
MSSDSAVRAAVRIEDQVVYGYGVVGARLRGSDRRFAATRLAVHQQLRDDLRGLGVDTPPAAPAYQLPFPVTDSTGARLLAVRLEDAAARAAWALVATAAAQSTARRMAIDVLADVATAAARWRVRAGLTDDPALPGQPATASARQPSTTPTISPSSSTTASGSTS